MNIENDLRSFLDFDNKIQDYVENSTIESERGLEVFLNKTEEMFESLCEEWRENIDDKDTLVIIENYEVFQPLIDKFNNKIEIMISAFK